MARILPIVTLDVTDVPLQIAGDFTDVTGEPVVDLRIVHSGLETDGTTPSTAVVYLVTVDAGEAVLDTLARVTIKFDNTATPADPYLIEGISLPTRARLVCAAAGEARLYVTRTVRGGAFKVS